MQTSIPRLGIGEFVFGDTRLAWLWFIVRLYLGYEWLMAGWDKFNNPAWVGAEAGTAVKGFLSGALGKMSGAHPDVSGWYGYFIENVALPNSTLFSYLVTFGEIAVGIALILGFLTGTAAFFGTFMNFQFLFAGTVSVNPEMVILSFLLMLAWRTAGWYGLDRFVLPRLLKRPYS